MTEQIPVEQYRARLLELSGQPDSYPFLTLADAYLRSVPEDEQLRALVAGALLKKGLISTALELIRATPQQDGHVSQLRTLETQLSALPSDLIPWTTTQPRYAANLQALRRRGQQRLAGEIDTVWARFVPAIELHAANDGNLLVRGDPDGGGRRWIPGALNFRAMEAIPPQEAESWKGTLPRPFLMDSVGIGWLIPLLHAATDRTYLNYSSALFIVEPSLLGLAVVLHLHDWTAVLSDPRVSLSAGEQAWEQWAAMMQLDQWLGVPRLVGGLARWGANSPATAQAWIDRVQAGRETLYDTQRERALALYNDLDAAWWAERYASISPERPLRVVGLTSRFTTYLQHSTRDALAAFERCGAVTKLLIEDRDFATIPTHAYMQTFAEFQPDLVLVIDHHRHEYCDRFIPQIPFVCWIQDELVHLFDPDVGSKLGPLDFTIGFGLTRCVLQANYPRDRFMPCRTAMAPEKLARDDGILPGSLCDVSYVSHASETPADLHQRVRAQAGSEAARRLMDAFYESTRELFAGEVFNGAWDLDRLLDQVQQELGLRCETEVSRERMMSLFVRPLADRSLRHSALHWAADWADASARRLHIYGNGWERHPRFGRYAQGPAQHGDHLGRIARGSAINLHLGLNPALHQRVFEMLGAGGFVMVRYHLFDFFPDATALLEEHLRAKGIDRPSRIPLEEMPPEYVADVRARAARRGASVPTHVELTREWLLERAARSLEGDRYHYADQAFPGFQEVTFQGRESFAQRADYFLEHPEHREALSTPMRQAVYQLFTYDALVPRIIRFVRDGLAAYRPINSPGSSLLPAVPIT